MTPGFVFEQAKTTTGVTSSLIADVDVRLDHFDESGLDFVCDDGRLWFHFCVKRDFGTAFDRGRRRQRT